MYTQEYRDWQISSSDALIANSTIDNNHCGYTNYSINSSGGFENVV